MVVVLHQALLFPVAFVFNTRKADVSSIRRLVPTTIRTSFPKALSISTQS